MKDKARRSSLTNVFLVVSLMLMSASFGFLYLNLIKYQAVEEQVLNTKPQKVKIGIPLQLLIPAIGIDANIQLLGVSASGQMEVPDNIVDVGWFKMGSRPGEVGSAVIAGHLDGKQGEPGIFANLDKLTKGDLLMVKDDMGNSTVFVVRDKRAYDPGFANEVFSQNDGVHLNLITCDGVWEKNIKSYSKRLVVFADAVNQ